MITAVKGDVAFLSGGGAVEIPEGVGAMPHEQEGAAGYAFTGRAPDGRRYGLFVPDGWPAYPATLTYHLGKIAEKVKGPPSAREDPFTALGCRERLVVDHCEMCPACGRREEYQCDCPRAEKVCPAGHRWHWCAVHDRLAFGASAHPPAGCSCDAEIVP